MYPAKPENPTDTAHAFQVLETQHSALEVGTFRSEDTRHSLGGRRLAPVALAAAGMDRSRGIPIFAA